MRRRVLLRGRMSGSYIWCRALRGNNNGLGLRVVGFGAIGARELGHEMHVRRRQHGDLGGIQSRR
jgi:hypothetical protein